MSTAVLLALSGDDTSLLRTLTAPGTGLTVARRCADLAELLAAAAAGLGQLAVIDCALDQVDLTVLDRLGRAGVRCLLLAPAQQLPQWGSLGAPVEDRAAGPQRLLEAVQRLAQQETSPGPDLARESSWPFAEAGGWPGQPQPVPVSAPTPAEPGHGGSTAALVDNQLVGYPPAGAPGLQAVGPGDVENMLPAGWLEAADRAAAGPAAVGVPAYGWAGAEPAAAAKTPVLSWAEAFGAAADCPADAAPGAAAQAGAGGGAAPVCGSPTPTSLPTVTEPGEAASAPAAPSSPSRAWVQGRGPQRPGRLVVVWGTAGAPGRSTVAASLATGLRAVGEVVLVDADLEAPSLVQLLGMPEDSSALATAARLATHGGLDQETFRGLQAEVSPGVRLLSGLGRQGRWRELPPVSMEVVWNRCRAQADWTVVDVAGGLVEDELDELTLEPGRGAVVADLLTRADVVLVVGGADPVGVRRLLQMLAEVRLQGWQGRLEVVVNRVRASAAGPSPKRAVREALSRFGGLQDVLLLPEDAATADRALLEGRAVLEMAASSELGKALHELVVRVDPAAAPALRQRQRQRRKDEGRRERRQREKRQRERRGLFARRRAGAEHSYGVMPGAGSASVPGATAVPAVGSGPVLGAGPGAAAAAGSGPVPGAGLGPGGPVGQPVPTAVPAAGALGEPPVVPAAGGPGVPVDWPGAGPAGDTPPQPSGRHRR